MHSPGSISSSRTQSPLGFSYAGSNANLPPPATHRSVLVALFQFIYHLDKLIFTIYGINTLSAIGFLLLLKQGMLECGSKKIPLLETNIKMPSNGFRICSMANDIFVCISSESVQKFSVSKTYV